MNKESAPKLPGTGAAVWFLLGVVAGGAALWHLTVLTAFWVSGQEAPGLAETLAAFLRSPIHPAAGYDSLPVPAAVLYTFFGLVFVILVVAGAYLLAAVTMRSRARKSGWTLESDVEGIQRKKAIATARGIGAPETMSDDDAIVFLGHMGTKPVYGQHEDSHIAIAPARSGKTTGLVVNWILDAPGACVATSTKAEIVYLTAALRQKKTDSTVAVFDPKQVSGWPDQIRWNPVRGCENLEEAMSRGKALAGGNRKGESSGNIAFFDDSGAMLLGFWLHAAAMKPGGSMRDVMNWASDFDDKEPLKWLNESQDALEVGWPDRLKGMTNTKADQTTGSLKMTILRSLSALNNPRVLALLCPPDEETAWDVDRFIESNDTLYILTEPGDETLTPILTMLTDFIMRRAQKVSQMKSGYRLWPPIRFVLDEVTNIAPLPTLPSIVSDSGGRGVTVMMVVQGRAQLRERWGREGAETILHNASVEYYLPGIKDAELTKELSQRTTEYRAERMSVSSGGGSGSNTVSTEWDHALHAEQITELAVGTALVFYRNQKFMVLTLTPFYKRKDAHEIEAGIETFERKTGRKAEAA